MRRDGHDDAGAVCVEDEVRDVYRHARAVEGVYRVGACEDALFFRAFGDPFEARLPYDPFDKFRRLFFLGLALDEGGREGMLGGYGHVRDAEDGVGAGREYAEALFAAGGLFEGEFDLGPGALAYPVLLHGEDALGPAVFELFGEFEELVGICSGLEEPPFHFLLDDLGAAAPAVAVLDLLVGEDRLARGAPVDGRRLPVGEPLFVHAGEDHLLPFVVSRVAGGDLARPVVAVAEFFELGLHLRDVLVCPLGGMDAPFDGGVLRREAECVPAYGVEDVVAHGPLETGDDVADCVVPDVAHVDAARGIGEHFEDVVFVLPLFGADFVEPLLVPGVLEFFLYFVWFIAIFHYLLAVRKFLLG